MTPALDLSQLFAAIDEACQRSDLPPLYLLIGTLEVARERCLRVIGCRLGQSKEASQGVTGVTRPGDRVRDRWISPQEAAQRLNISVRTLSRRSTKPPYSSFCVAQPKRGFKVSEAGLEEFQRHARG